MHNCLLEQCKGTGKKKGQQEDCCPVGVSGSFGGSFAVFGAFGGSFAEKKPFLVGVWESFGGSFYLTFLRHQAGGP